MANEIETVSGTISPFERIRRTNEAGNEYWSSRDFAPVLGYTDCHNFEQVVQKAKTACFNGRQRIEDHFVDVTDMVFIMDYAIFQNHGYMGLYGGPDKLALLDMRMYGY